MALFDLFKTKAESATNNGASDAESQGVGKAASATGDKKEKLFFLLYPHLLRNSLLCLRPLCPLRLTQPQ